jgi:hypothetical protein
MMTARSGDSHQGIGFNHPAFATISNQGQSMRHRQLAYIAALAAGIVIIAGIGLATVALVIAGVASNCSSWHGERRRIRRSRRIGSSDKAW